MMNNIIFSALTIAALLITAASPAHSFVSDPNFGEGYIVELTEGDWNYDRIYIKLSYTKQPASGMTLWYHNYVRFSASLSAERQQSIRQLAHLALMNDSKVGINSTNTTCKNATELLIE